MIQLFVYSILSASMPERERTNHEPHKNTVCTYHNNKKVFKNVLMVVFLLLVPPAFVELVYLHSSISLLIEVKSLEYTLRAKLWAVNCFKMVILHAIIIATFFFNTEDILHTLMSKI